MSKIMYNGNFIGYELLKMKTGAELRGTNSEKSNHNKLIVFIPAIDTYVLNINKNMSDIHSFKQDDIEYLSIHEFLNRLIDGDLFIFEVLGVCKNQTAMDLYVESIDQYFAQFLNKIESMKSGLLDKDQLVNIYGNIVQIYSNELQSAEKKYEDSENSFVPKRKKEKGFGGLKEMLSTVDNEEKEQKSLYVDTKIISLVFSYLNELVELIGEGTINFPLDSATVSKKIKYDKDFYIREEDNIHSTIQSSLNIINEALTNDDDAVCKFFPNNSKAKKKSILKVKDTLIVNLFKDYFGVLNSATTELNKTENSVNDKTGISQNISKNIDASQSILRKAKGLSD